MEPDRPCDQCGKVPEGPPGTVRAPGEGIDLAFCSPECMLAWFREDTERMQREATDGT